MFGELTTPPDEQTGNKATVVLVAALIDESGSMMDVRSDTIGGYNSFIATIQGEQAGRKAFVSTFLFDSRSTPALRIIQDGGDLHAAIPLTEKNYSPQALTPLYDAIGLAVEKIDAAATKAGATKITFLIQTDGQENASQEYTHAAVKALIEARTKAGWQIVFLGADLSNAHSIGTGLGVSAANSMMYTKGNTNQMFTAMASSTSAYRAAVEASASVTLSNEQKRKLAGN